MSNVVVVIQANIRASSPGSIDCFICGKSVMRDLLNFVEGFSNVAVVRAQGTPRVEEFMGVPVVLARNAQHTRLEVIHRNGLGEIEIQVLRW